MVIKRHLIQILAGVVLVLSLTIFVTPAVDVFADMASGGGSSTTGSGAGDGCGWDYSTCYGATWRWYPWPAGATSVPVSSGSSSDHTQSFTISGNDAKVCAAAGGYYRYGMVSKSTGQQVGSLPISGNASNTFNSNMLGGGMHYRGSNEPNGGVDWNVVAQAYNAAAQANHYTSPGLVAGSNLMWFCSSQTGAGGGGSPDGGGTTPAKFCENQKPASYSSNETSISTFVKNLALPYDYSSDAWAGPGQTVEWLHCYYPGVQKMASKTVTENNKKPGTWTCATLIPDQYAKPPEVKSIFNSTNKAFSDVTTFQNYFNITGGSNNGSFSRSKKGGEYSTGVSAVQSVTDDYVISGGNVKDTIWEYATTGYPTSVSRSVSTKNTIRWYCPYYKWEVTVKDWVSNADVCGAAHATTYDCNCETVVDEDNSYCKGGYQPPDYSCNCKHVPGAPSYVEQCDTCTPDYICTDYHYEYKEECDTCTHEIPCAKPIDKWGWVKYTSKSNNGNEYISWSTNGKTASSSKANVKTPINYAISSSITIGNTVPYAGEQASVGDARIYNNSKWNSQTMSSYATGAKNVWYKLIAYTSNHDETDSGWTATGDVCSGKSNCVQSASTEIKQTIGANSSYLITGQYGSFNVPDISAGNYICVALAYWPTNSGSSTNMGDYNGDGQWGVSNPSCKIIAKKPSFQVWGGGVYSLGAVSLNAAYKTNLAGVSGRGYSMTGKGNTTVFGSWAEQAVAGTSTIAELASGSPMTGGSYEGNGYATGYCNYRTPLSLSNYSTSNLAICPNQQKTGGMPSANNVVNRKSLVESLVKGGANTSAGTIDLNNTGHYTETTDPLGKKIRYTYRSSGLSIQGATVNAGIVHVVRSDNDITITGDIKYQKASFKTVDEVPKLVIYAKNIKINCNVKQVDAVLLAENEINTCANSSDINAQANSNQLRINGTIVTNKLKLNRTYGAATGTNSAVPAEIINYDTSLILWFSNNKDSDAVDKLDITYQQELAPRY